ncbi:MAG: bacillithiol biosynthesis BshC, partial [Myxococcales bacterium]|nr:bacillithiol biosynthesis BshC [Myxococcales bacterium]
KALDAAAEIDAALQARSEALQTAGFAVQVTLRPGSPLTFYRPAAIDGPRHRLEPDGAGRWRLIGAEGVLTPAELHAALEAEPGRFATSALLRPILQDLWLPTAAYVSGPGELAYWAQMPPLYTVFGLDVPLVIPRARLQIADETTHRLLEQLGLTLADLDRDREALLARCARPSADHPRPEAIGRALLEPLQATLTAFAPHAEAVDKGLAQAAKRTGEAIEDLAGRLIDRYRRALIAGDDVAAARLDRLLARMRPNGGPQERTLGWPTFAARLGVAPFIDAVLAAISPYDGALRTLTP